MGVVPLDGARSRSLLRLDSVVPAVLLAVSAVPLTIMGGQAGVLQGERRWFSLAGIYLAMGLGRVVVGTLCIVVSPTESAAMLGVMIAMFAPAIVGWLALRRPGMHVRDSDRHSDQHTARRIVTETGSASLALLAFFVLLQASGSRRDAATAARPTYRHLTRMPPPVPNRIGHHTPSRRRRVSSSSMAMELGCRATP